jgi:hypothetical protein
VEENEEVDDVRLQVIDSDDSARFQSAMAEQSRRAHDFEARLKSSRLRHLLADVVDPSGRVVDLRPSAEPVEAVLPD